LTSLEKAWPEKMGLSSNNCSTVTEFFVLEFRRYSKNWDRGSSFYLGKIVKSIAIENISSVKEVSKLTILLSNLSVVD
jgi:hypothetical protein